jgi:hypothetical protein
MAALDPELRIEAENLGADLPRRASGKACPVDSAGRYSRAAPEVA